MKIAISAAGQNLDSQVDPRFGRCQNFVILDTDTMEFEAVSNESAAAAGGAGIATAQMIAGKGVEAVVTGNCGPNAFGVLNSAGIKVMTGASGTVQEAVENFKAGKLQESSQASAGAHSGMRRGGGQGSNA
ncbi:MAG: NifB/NifX family molybdenum-iron cluster-binding protein [Dehalococcoidales bacterium]|nr:NifB/NifX family molybdenum-iron cluster-binding protein [Dehalococcoidales bacterium]